MAQDVAEKVALLLAKAEGTDNPAEAEAYTRKAETLMMKYSLDQAEIAAKRPGTKVDEIVTIRIPVVSQYAAALVGYGYAVSDAFSLRAYQQLTTGQGAKATSWIWLVGHKSDAEQAETLVKSLLVQAEHAMKFWWANEGRVTCAALPKSKQYAARREFFYAFASGVRSRLAEVRKTVVSEAGSGAELVLVDRKKQVDQWAASNIRTSKTTAGRTQAGDYSARVAGHAAGREAVGQKAVR